jgi:hypothetical protein
MKLSKTKFLHYIRSEHTIDFTKTYQREIDEGSLSDQDLFDMLDLEVQDKKRIIFNRMKKILKDSDDETYEVDEAKRASLDQDLDVMQPYYEAIERLSERKIIDTFGGDVHYSRDTFSQKYFQTHRNDYDFFAFLDAYQEDEKLIRIIETKATTSLKFQKLSYSYKKEDYPIFVKSTEGIFRLRHELGLVVHDGYFKKLERLMDINDDVGKYIYDLAYQRFVVDHSDPKTKPHQYYLSVLNSEYRFDGTYDDEGKPIHDNSIMVFIDLTELTERIQDKLIKDVDIVINKLNHMSLEAIKLEETIMRGRKLIKEKYDALIGVDYPITNFYNSHNGFKNKEYTEKDLIDMKILSFDDIPESWLSNENQRIQYEAYKTNKPYIDKARIKSVLDFLKYPLYHLDFETFPCPLPRFKGEVPYEQSVFQFSLHIERAPGVCDKDKDHFEFLAPDHKDYREEIARLLTTIIKDDGGHVIAYNVGFEKMIMKSLARHFPKYSEKLLNRVDRAFDLKDILQGNSRLFDMLGFGKETRFNFYDKEQRGSFSIKKVLPVLSDLTYEGMPVGNGTDAIMTYARFPKLLNENKALYEREYKDLIDYCKQDTWAMVEIINKINK